MKILLKLNLTVICFVSFLSFSYSQEYYYSQKKKNFLTEDTTILIIKAKDDRSSFVISQLPFNYIQNYDTSRLKGVISIKLKSGTKRKDLLHAIRNIDNAEYAWHSLQMANTFIIPTGEILLQPKKGILLDSILLVTHTAKNIVFKKLDKYGVITLTILNDDSLFTTSNKIYESGLVDWCHPNFWFPIKHTTTDPLFSDQWYLKNTGQFSGTSGIDINIENAWALTTGSSSIKIAVIDDGVEDHEDISGRVLSGNTPRNSNGYGAPTSSGKHGEACAGIIAATQNNSTGIAGIAPNCKIVPVNIFYGGETTSDLANGINWAWDNGQGDVLSNSWTYNTTSQSQSGFDAIIQAITNARTNGRGGKGSVVVFSSGNDYEGVHFPANVDGVITVGAIDNNGNLWSYSNTGSSMDLVTPSSDGFSAGIRTTDRMGSAGYSSGNYTTSFGGTSAACPQVSGVAALLLSVNPNLTESQVTNILQTTATDMGTTGFDNSFGYGRLNACGAVNKALASTLSISGDAEVCSTSNAYTVNNLPLGASVTWSATPNNIVNINCTSCTQTTLTKLNDGIITLSANVTTNCGNFTINAGQISVGSPRAADIVGMDPSTYFSAGQIVTLSVNESALAYNWDIYGGTVIGSSTEQSVTVRLDNCFNGQNAYNDFDANVYLTNACGTSSVYHEHTYATCDGGPMLLTVAPNPSTSVTEVTLSEKADKTKKKDIKEIRITDKMGNIKQMIKYGAGTQTIILNVSSLPTDVYTISAFDGKVWTSTKFSKN